ncbi:hypothetical protein D3C75_671410 [compost metagenome]
MECCAIPLMGEGATRVQYAFTFALQLCKFPSIVIPSIPMYNSKTTSELAHRQWRREICAEGYLGL